MKLFGVFAIGALAAAGLAGWVMNIYKLVTAAGPIAEFGALEVVRVIGIFIAPLGAVVGYM